MVGPNTPNARTSTVRFISFPDTGGPSSRFGLAGSAPNATADKVSVPMSSARICSTPSANGNRPPDTIHTTNGISSATLSVRWYVRKRRMFTYVARPCSIPATMLAK